MAAMTPSHHAAQLRPVPSSVRVPAPVKARLSGLLANSSSHKATTPSPSTSAPPANHAAIKPAAAHPPSTSMTRRQLISSTLGTAGWVFAAGCTCCSEAQANASWDYTSGPKPIYSKSGPAGPANWPGTCFSGRQQSPVNLPLADSKRQWSSGRDSRSIRFKDLDFQYGAAKSAFVSNPGHGSMQVNYAPGNVCFINGEAYQLLQFHFHTPSEHSLDGTRFAMEAHLVHKSLSTGRLAVVGAMLDGDGEQNVSLQTALEYGPQPGATVNLREPVDPMLLLPSADDGGHRPFVHYPGSLTTPPCSEKVDWFVMTQPVRVGSGQILKFINFVGGNKTYGQNARPLQQEYGRQFDYVL